MGRFRKGTLDHDGDGNMGGSNPKETTMATTKKPAQRAATKREVRPDPQSGMDASGPATEEKKAAEKRRFAEADAKGEPTPEEIEEARIGREVRGW